MKKSSYVIVDRKKILTDEGKRKIIDLSEKETSIRNISVKSGLPASLVSRFIKNENIKLKPRKTRYYDPKIIKKSEKGKGGKLYLTEEGKKHVKSMIEKSATLTQIETYLNTNHSTTTKLISEAGLSRENLKKKSRQDIGNPQLINEVKSLFIAGKTRNEISIITNCSTTNINHILLSFGVHRNSIRQSERELTTKDRKDIAEKNDLYLKKYKEELDWLWNVGLPFTKLNLENAGIPGSQKTFSIICWKLISTLSERELKAGPPGINSTEDFMRFVDPVLKDLPNTSASDKTVEPTSKYFFRLLRYIARIKDWRMRNMLAIYALIKSSQNRSFYSFYTHTNTLRRSLDKITQEYGEKSIFDEDKFGEITMSLSSDNERGLNISRHQRLNFLGSYRSMAHTVFSYLSIVDET
ncbi:MAG: hypothetical protein ABJQ78_09020 [Alloalcanivorax sp.]